MTQPTSPSSTSPSPSRNNAEITGRAILVGLACGVLICFTNCYFGLQSSWISMSSMQAALIGYGLIQLMPRTSQETMEQSATPIELPATLMDRFFWSWFGQGRFTPQENVVLQTTGVAMGAMPLTVGLIGIIPALLQIKPERDNGATPIVLVGSPLLLWSAALALFGVFFAVPLRKKYIIHERLAFPSGTATAHLISVLHGVKLRDHDDHSEVEDDGQAASTSCASAAQSTRNCSKRRNWTKFDGPGEEQSLLRESPASSSVSPVSPQRYHSIDVPSTSPASADDDVLKGPLGWKTLLYSFAASIAFTISSALFPVLYAIPLFDIIPPHNLAAKWGWYFTPSLSYVGQGIIMGLHTTTSMLAGAIFGWAFLSPLVHHRGWTEGEPMDPDDGSRGWILWISLAIMTSESLIGLLVIASSEINFSALRDTLSLAQKRTPPRSLLEGGQSSISSESEMEEDDEPPERLPPTTAVLIGLILSSIFALIAMCHLFGSQGIEPYTTLIAILLAFALSILAVRSLGQTDLNPVNGLGKISQLIFAFLQPRNLAANLVAGALSEAGAMSSGELMQDFKAGHLLYASPRAQFYGQLIGSIAGVFVSTFAYQLYLNVYDIPSPSFPAPASQQWLNFARLVNNGTTPTGSKEWMSGCAIFFGITGSIKAIVQARELKRNREGKLEKTRSDGARGRENGRRVATDQGSSSADVAKWEKWAYYLPSGIAFSVGILNTPNFSIARFIGGLVSYWWTNRQRNNPTSVLSTSSSRVLIIILASGFVLGEGAGSIVNLFMKTWGLMGTVSCVGCRGSCGGGC